MTARFRIFVSSPSDVFAERERLERVIVRLDGEYGGGVLEAVRWERAYYSAAKTFQDQIPLPSETDLVVCILWKRLGFELPPDYRRADGTTPTGTEFEFENAMAASRARGTPDVLVYRKAAPVMLDAEQVEIERAQFEALKQFWSRWFRNESGHFTAAFQSFETTDGFEAAVEGHIRQWLARHNVASAGVTWPVELMGSPFRGLEAFDACHADVFFGRRRAVERARERLAAAAARGTPFLLILGASGSGKSSLARAGVLPRLVKPGAVPGVDVWRSCVMRPSTGDSPLDALARALYGAGSVPELAGGDCPTAGDFARLLAHAPDAAARALRLALGRATSAMAAREQFGRAVEARLLLVVDQFEEALTDAAARDAFARALAALAATGAAWVVATLRSDLYALFQASPPLVGLREGGAQLDLTRPSLSELGEMVEGPATAAGLRFERMPDGAGLDEVLTAAADQAGALPLLQMTLEALFESRDQASGVLTVAAYAALGGLSGVIERRAEATLSGLDAAAQAALPGVLRGLVNVAGDGVVTSRTAPAEQVARTPEGARLVAAFAAARLLVAEDGPGGRLRVAHDALLSGWPRAAALIAADREALRTRGRIEAAAQMWRQEGRDPDFLLPPGRALAEAVDLAAHHAEGLDADSLAFVEASRAADAARKAEAQAAAERELRLRAEAQEARADAATRRVRATRVAVGVVSVLLLLAAGAAVYAESERRVAIARTGEAEQNFAAALGAGASMVDAANAHLRDGGMSREVARTLLSTAEASLDGLAHSGRAASLPLRDEQARLATSFSAVQLALCDSAGARERAMEAVSLAEAAAAEASTPARTLARVRALDTLGQAAFGDSDVAGAVAAYRRAEAAAVQGGLADDDAVHGVRRDLGTALLVQETPAEALAVFRDDLAWETTREAAHPDDPAILGRMAFDLRRIASLALNRKDVAEASDALAREAALLARLAALQPGNFEWPRALSINARQMSQLAGARGDRAAALAQARTAADLAARVAAHDPANGEWQRDFVYAQVNVAALLARGGEAAGAVAVLRPMLATVKALSGPASSSAACKGDAAKLSAVIGYTMALTQDPDAAAAALEASLAIVEGIARAAPGDAARQHELAAAHLSLARAYDQGKHFAQAAAEYRAGVSVLAPLIPAAGAATPEWQHELSELRIGLGDMQLRQGDAEGALASYEAARDAALAVAEPAPAPSQHAAVTSQLRIAAANAALHRPAEQSAALRDAVARAERLVASDAKTPEWRHDLADARERLAEFDALRGAVAEALSGYRGALALAETLYAEDPNDARWRAALVGALKLTAQAAKMNGLTEESETFASRAEGVK